MIIPILYTATVMPFEIFFVDDTSVPGWFAADITITVLFFLDMVMNLNVAYFDDAGFPVSKRCAGGRLWLLVCEGGVTAFKLGNWVLSCSAGVSRACMMVSESTYLSTI